MRLLVAFETVLSIIREQSINIGNDTARPSYKYAPILRSTYTRRQGSGPGGADASSSGGRASRRRGAARRAATEGSGRPLSEPHDAVVIPWQRCIRNILFSPTRRDATGAHASRGVRTQHRSTRCGASFADIPYRKRRSHRTPDYQGRGDAPGNARARDYTDASVIAPRCARVDICPLEKVRG